MAAVSVGAASVSIPSGAEVLHYNINWPSGLTLGEATLRAVHAPDTATGPGGVDVELTIDASIPGFQIVDKYHSVESAGYCSIRFNKSYSHGSRKSEETTTFDPQQRTATRATANSDGKSDFTTPACPHDMLAFLYFVRSELTQGRLPQQQPLFFGAVYDVRLQFRDTEPVKLTGRSVDADRITVSFRGPASHGTFDMFLAKDAVRTPVLFRVPLSIGVFSAELAK